MRLCSGVLLGHLIFLWKSSTSTATDSDAEETIADGDGKNI
jgi:hypothetical protein